MQLGIGQLRRRFDDTFVRWRQHHRPNPRVIEKIENINDQKAQQTNQNRGQRNDAYGLVDFDDRGLNG